MDLVTDQRLIAVATREKVDARPSGLACHDGFEFGEELLLAITDAFAAESQEAAFLRSIGDLAADAREHRAVGSSLRARTFRGQGGDSRHCRVGGSALQVRIQR